MHIKIGNDLKTGQAVVIDTDEVINGHLQVSGITGTGKTHRLIALIESMVESAGERGEPLRVHVIDPHGDIHTKYSSTVKFSEATGFGYNPLEINIDPDYGGVRRAVNKFIAAIGKYKTLGEKQRAVLANLLEDLYAEHGFLADHPETWVPENSATVRRLMAGREERVYLNVPYPQRDRFQQLVNEASGGSLCGGFDKFEDIVELKNKKSCWVHRDCYHGDFLMWQPKILFKTAPTLDNAVSFVERKLKASYCGANTAVMTLLEDVNRTAKAYHRRIDQLSKTGGVLSDETEELRDAMIKAKNKAIQAFTSYCEAIAEGRELDEIIRYGTRDVLQSVYERLQNLRSIGIYNSTPPPFDTDAPIWHYMIRPLELGTQRLLVDLVCTRIFENAMHSGIKSSICQVIVLDEGKRWLTDSEDDVLQKIANEARKFGLGLWMASQTPGHFSDDFLKATGTILILGLAPADNGLAARKLGISDNLLNQVTPRYSALLQKKEKGKLSSEFELVRLA